MKPRLLVFFLALIPFASFLACGPEEGPAPGSSAVVLYGDSRTGHDVHAALLGDMATHEPAMVFHTGDMVEDGNNPADWAAFNALTGDLRKGAPFWPALGNHENEAPLYFANFDLPGNEQWYAVQRDGVRYVILDTNVPFDPASEQYKWLEAELKSYPAGWLVVLFHHPPYTLSREEETGTQVRRYLVPLFEQYDADVVASGHDHNYQHWRVNGIDYLVTGGGGAPLYDKGRDDPRCLKFLMVHHYCLLTPGATALHVAAYDADGHQLDAFDVAP